MDIIAIDCGASFIKAARISEEGNILKSVVEKTPMKKEAGHILRILETVQLVKKLICELASDLFVVRVGFSTEMHGFVVTDKDGMPYIDYISWKDEYGRDNNKEMDEIRMKFTNEEILKTGMPIKVGLPSVNLYYILKYCLGRIPKKDIYFYTLGDFIIRSLSNNQPYIHCTNAAGTGLYDIYRDTWNDSIINKLEIGEIHFPEIYTHQASIETQVEHTKLHIFPAIGDQQAALLGSAFWNENSLSLNFGTGAQISVVKKKVEVSDLYQTRPYFKGYYLNTIPHIPSGRALNVYFNFVKEVIEKFALVDDDAIWCYILNEAEKNDKGDLEIDMSFFTNALTSYSYGNINRIREEEFTIGNLFRSVYLKMATTIKLLVDKLGIEEIEEIVFSGGVMRKTPLLRQLVLREFPKVQRYTIAENETLLGIYKFINDCIVG